MIGISIELKTTCNHCSSPLMMNAFTELILCSACGKNNRFPQDEWQNLLEDAVKEAPGFDVGVGQPSTIMRGEYTYKLTYGRQDPRCPKCKTGINLNKIEEFSATGETQCAKCSNTIFIRKPDELVAKSFPGVKYLVGENEDQLKFNPDSGKLPVSSKPVLFTCPSCAGNLEVDGSDRMITCKFCNSQVYLPDDLWFRLHPAKEVARWYIVIDDKAVPPEGVLPEWYYLSDMISDKDSNTYFATAVEGDEDFIVWSINKELNTRWIRKGLKYEYEHAKLAIAPDGNLFVWNTDSHSLLKISSSDGTDISKLNGSKDRKKLNMKGCTRMVSCPDGSLLTLINNVFARFAEDGERLPLWQAKKLGFFSVGEGDPIPNNDGEYAPYVKDVGNIPKRLSGDFTYINTGLDGYLYMLDRSSSDGELAKYEQSGTKVWSKFIPLGSKEGRPVQDDRGYIYIIGTDEKSNTRIIRYNTAGDSFETIITDLREGGFLEEEDKITVFPDGTIIAAKFHNRMKVFSPSFEMIFRSEQSKEDDELEKRRRKSKVESDEEFEDD
jgi:DNA-directed RNA polymerase subunit RPC12/RpoP